MFLSVVLKGEVFLWWCGLPEEPELDLQTIQDLFLESGAFHESLMRPDKPFLERKGVPKRTDDVAEYHGHFWALYRYGEAGRRHVHNRSGSDHMVH